MILTVLLHAALVGAEGCHTLPGAPNDPFPADSNGGFGVKQGVDTPLINEATACATYGNSLHSYATAIIKRHDATLFINDNDCTVTKLIHGAEMTDELLWSETFSGNPHFIRLGCSRL
jgi:hypothetical protein